MYGDIIVTLRLGSLALMDRLDEGRHRRHHIKPDFAATMRQIATKTKILMSEVRDLEKLFTTPAAKNYGPYVKTGHVPPRLVRVGSPVVTEDSEGKLIHIQINPTMY